MTQRLHLRRPAYRQITQGTVFCCARAARYDACQVHGLVITARCDISQRKYPILNYLPVVSLPDWLRRDGLDILTDDELSNQNGTLKGLLRDACLSHSLVSSVPLTSIADVHFPVDEGSRKQIRLGKRFREHITLMDDFSALQNTTTSNERYLWFCENRPSLVENVIQRLSRHAVLGHYFFETLSPDTQHSVGYICLLREVSTLPKLIGEQLGSGLTESDCRHIGSEPSSTGLSFDEVDMAMPVVEVGSPTIEHLLQSFSTLFGRIGVPDPVDEHITAVITLNMNQPGSAQ